MPLHRTHSLDLLDRGVVIISKLAVEWHSIFCRTFFFVIVSAQRENLDRGRVAFVQSGACRFGFARACFAFWTNDHCCKTRSFVSAAFLFESSASRF